MAEWLSGVVGGSAIPIDPRYFYNDLFFNLQNWRQTPPLPFTAH